MAENKLKNQIRERASNAISLKKSTFAQHFCKITLLIN